MNPRENSNFLLDIFACGYMGGSLFGVFVTNKDTMSHARIRNIVRFGLAGSVLGFANNYMQQYYTSWKEYKL